MLPLLMLRELLLEQVDERIVEAVLLEIRPGDTGRILLRRKVIDLLISLPSSLWVTEVG